MLSPPATDEDIMTIHAQVEQRRQERCAAAKARATHAITRGHRGTEDDNSQTVEHGFTVTTLDGTPTDFVPVHQQVAYTEEVAALRAHGYEPLGFGYVRRL